MIAREYDSLRCGEFGVKLAVLWCLEDAGAFRRQHEKVL
jgi:hypothetical protein